jgi:Family of unknown function (DUF6261)
MIQDIPYSILINGEFIGLFTNINNTCNDSDPVLLKIDAPLVEVTTAVTAINTLYVRQQKSGETANVTTIDALRDRYITGIKKVVNGYTYHYDENIVKAATTIELCIDKYGSNIAKQSLVTETATLDKLAVDFETDDKVKAALALLNLTNWGGVLKQTNVDFNDTYLVRNVEYAERPEGDMLELRKVVEAKFDILKRHIEGHNLFTPSAAYDSLINKINSLINQYVATAKRRRYGGGGNDAPPNDNPPV